MRLRDFVRPDLVVLDLDSTGVEDTIQTLVDRLQRAQALPAGSSLAEVLLTREGTHTTVMGNGVAVPHANVAGVDGPLIMVAVSREGVAFGPPGGDPVHLFFLLLSPPDRAGAHIKLLARIARLLRHPGFVEELSTTHSREELLESIARVDAEHL